ncbi:hypothetical protein B0F90DRAFT_1722485 [Multifurca ochricompacta]|uniref:Uncharacterized protein n=1 Tax=Multifurca ochricompacta TaxID=376703 RepID=A0AAD4M5U9_9AGAM|nr:hypothetical protein B0F90DRAFT_1722485 [Multifurca ochricompacta]
MDTDRIQNLWPVNCLCLSTPLRPISVFLFGDIGHLVRWHRSGVIYTEPFKWAAEPKTLFEFI